MRPPQNAGESCQITSFLNLAWPASMRPPQNAGESFTGLLLYNY